MERIGATPFVLQLQVTSAAARPKVKEQGNVCFPISAVSQNCSNVSSHAENQV